VEILKQPNLDVASWNLFGREIHQNQQGDPGSFTVDGWPLITYHFSGTGPNGAHKWVREIFDPGNGATAEIEGRYDQAALRRFAPEVDWQAIFERFDAGLRRHGQPAPLAEAEYMAAARRLVGEIAALAARLAGEDEVQGGRALELFLEKTPHNLLAI